MSTVGILCPAVICRVRTCFVHGCTRMGLIYTSVGFQRCPSRRFGQCESLELWDGQRRIPRFIFVEVLLAYIIIVGDWGSIRANRWNRNV